MAASMQQGQQQQVKQQQQERQQEKPAGRRMTLEELYLNVSQGAGVGGQCGAQGKGG
jgi:hypothetical protein